MSNFALRLPDSLHDYAKTLAARDNTSLNQFIAMAVAEKVSALMTEEVLEERAKRGDRKKFIKVLSKVADVESEERDQNGVHQSALRRGEQRPGEHRHDQRKQEQEERHELECAAARNVGARYDPCKRRPDRDGEFPDPVKDL